MGTVVAAAVETAERFRALVVSGALELPLPGHGATGARWAALSALGAENLTVARLAEGHTDAAAILAELAGVTTQPGTLWGVWAAAPGTLRAERAGSGWRLTGSRKWCSGAYTCTDALVTAVGPDGPALFHARVGAGVEPVPDTWLATGMAASDSGTVEFTDAPAEPVGRPGDYTARPGFWHGGMGVAAVWLGGARGVARELDRLAEPDAHQFAHIGAVDALLATGQAVLDEAARQVDAGPGEPAEQLALRVRAAVERVATEVLDRVGRATGAGPLSLTAEHGTRVADLQVYLRQSHAERDLARLGELAAAQW
ncbi:acyl-CoA dehydrogenase family protein [Actinokineospora sp. NBRC 105648]|uniref:acyl-CoA dehydrogenase family protein n=1 Tax=Actinokineospora sp. NBRC 105648 TaxID=3032206 RepID=UPI002554BF4F|nr:acyl-CoA dehydrogenase family protein [Actinokineospora sp. NBRC 105648]